MRQFMLPDLGEGLEEAEIVVVDNASSALLESCNNHGNKRSNNDRGMN